MIERNAVTMEFPTHPAVSAIQKRLCAELFFRAEYGKQISPIEWKGRETLGVPSKAVRPEHMFLDRRNEEDKNALLGVYRNSILLRAMLEKRDVTHHEAKPLYVLEIDQAPNKGGEKALEDSRQIEFILNSPDFRLNFRFFFNMKFELDIDFKESYLGEMPRYRTGNSAFGNRMTKEEAGIIEFYTSRFLHLFGSPQEE